MRSAIAVLCAMLLHVSVMSVAAAKGDAALTEPKDLLAKLEAAFNAGDAKAAAALCSEDSHVISPAGADGQGRAGVEKVIASDLNGFLKGTKSKFSIESTRKIGSDTIWVDASHEATGAHGPDGKEMPPIKIHVVLLLVKKGGSLWLAEARPYAFIPAPPH